VDVQVQDNVVTLSGEVEDLSARNEAEQTARLVTGVYEVKNKLRIAQPTATEVQEMKERAMRMLRNSPFIDPENIEVSIEGSTASLAGFTGSYYAKAKAEDVVSRLPGITSVENNLGVTNDDLDWYYSPYFRQRELRDYPWYAGMSSLGTVDDAQILEDVKEEIFWSPFVNGENIRVSVEDGVVTLRGRVESLEEERAAVENAHEGGALRVENELEVASGVALN
jgi:osmotically-inducible protein OsmY